MAMTHMVVNAGPIRDKGRGALIEPFIVDEICARIANGESLTSICKLDGMPALGTVYAWMRNYPDFYERYKLAKDEQAATYVDMMRDIIDEVPWASDDGKIDPAFESWRKTRLDTLKWLAGVQRPREYGAKTVIAGDKDNPLAVNQSVSHAMDVRGLSDGDLETLMCIMTKALQKQENSDA